MHARPFSYLRCSYLQLQSLGFETRHLRIACETSRDHLLIQDSSRLSVEISRNLGRKTAVHAHAHVHACTCERAYMFTLRVRWDVTWRGVAWCDARWGETRLGKVGWNSCIRARTHTCLHTNASRLCYNFFRRRCNDSKCKFAHGYQDRRQEDEDMEMGRERKSESANRA